MMNKVNEEKYSDKTTIAHYASYSDQLQFPEKTILEILRPALGKMRMLDLGIGGGRTTPFFAAAVLDYLGTDLSEGMVKASEKKWGQKFKNIRFAVCDARDLSQFGDEKFDLVLFSFNGLDHISYEERELFINNIYRVLSPDGYLCFSSHNILHLPSFFSLHFRLHPIKFLKGLLGRKRLLKNNREALTNMYKADHVTVFDDVFDMGLYLCYVRPSAQIERLKLAGFTDIRLFSVNTGKEILESEVVSCTEDPWIYYLCRKVKT